MSQLSVSEQFQQPFTHDRRARFLEALSLSGNVRAAARTVSVAPMTAYRWRRADAHFARGWDAALVVARSAIEEVLADRAINGTEEEVFYKGELVATRRRFDNRLLLAHLARLDSKAQNRDLSAVAEDFDSALGRYAQSGEMLSDVEARDSDEEHNRLAYWEDEEEDEAES